MGRFGFECRGGISVEDDYESRFGNIGARWDIDQKRTTFNLDLSYTNSLTQAQLDHDLLPYLSFDQYYYDHVSISGNNPQRDVVNNGKLVGIRQDWATHFGVSHILNQNSVVGADFNYVRSTGYMANPYKLTQIFFVDPNNFQDYGGKEYATPDIQAFLERRPDVRNQWQIGSHYVQYIKALDAALHFNYQFSADDWVSMPTLSMPIGFNP